MCGPNGTHVTLDHVLVAAIEAVKTVCATCPLSIQTGGLQRHSLVVPCYLSPVPFRARLDAILYQLQPRWPSIRAVLRVHHK